MEDEEVEFSPTYNRVADRIPVTILGVNFRPTWFEFEQGAAFVGVNLWIYNKPDLDDVWRWVFMLLVGALAYLFLRVKINRLHPVRYFWRMRVFHLDTPRVLVRMPTSTKVSFYQPKPSKLERLLRWLDTILEGGQV